MSASLFPLIKNPDYVVGALLVLMTHAGLFGVLEAKEAARLRRLTSIPAIKAKDLIGTQRNFFYITLFLLLLLLVYTLLCVYFSFGVEGFSIKIGSEVISHNGLSYPLYFAALMTGTAGIAFAAFEKYFLFPRTIFHWILGIPDRFIDEYNQLILYFKSSFDRDPHKIFILYNKLIDENWINDAKTIIDASFYLEEIEKYNYSTLDPSHTEISLTEITERIEKLVFAAAISTTRKRGQSGIYDLSAKLGVPANKRPNSSQVLKNRKNLLGVTVLCLFSSIVMFTILSLLILLSEPHVMKLSFMENNSDWPNELSVSLFYNVQHFLIPSICTTLFLALSIAQIYPSFNLSWTQTSVYISLVCIVTVSLLFGSAILEQAFYSDQPFKGTAVDFFTKRILYNFLLSLIPVSCCIYYMYSLHKINISRFLSSGLAHISALLLTIALISLLWSWSYMRRDGDFSYDFLLCILAIHVINTIICIIFGYIYCRLVNYLN